MKPLRILLTTTSELKIQAVNTFFKTIGEIQIDTCHIPKNINIPEQPIRTGQKCAQLRAIWVKKNYIGSYDWLISIESEILPEDLVDIVQVYIEDAQGRSYLGESFVIPVPQQFYDEAKDNICADGLTVTIGERIHLTYPEIDAKNWMASTQFGGYNRVNQILSGLADAWKNINK